MPVSIESLWNDTRPPEQLPLEQFAYLPEWCVYVPLPGRQDGQGRTVCGVFGMLTDELRPRVLLTFDHPNGDLTHHSLPLASGPLQNVMQEHAEQHRSTARQNLGLQLPSSETHFLLNVLNVLTYLTSVGADLNGPAPTQVVKRRQQSKHHAETGELAEHNTVWEVGIRLGAALRLAQAAQTSQKPLEEGMSGQVKLRAHVRAAHYHSFRTGPADLPTVERPLRVRWLAPVAVNFEFGEDLPMVVRSVEA